MLDELLEEIQKLREYKTKYEYAEKDKKEMSDLLYKYMMAEYEGKSYDERVREYEKKTCSCCRYHSMCEGKKRLPLDILKPKPSDDKAWIPGRVGCGFFEWS